ncbi:MAG: hypothetical protein AB1416_11900, partial [Actinomycetota bacterium]
MADAYEESTRPPGPAARDILDWMQRHAARLRDLLAEEAEGADDLSPAGPAAIRGHLRFAAEALAAAVPPQVAPAVRTLAADLPVLIGEEEVEGELARVADAAAHEATLRFGEAARDDPALQPHLARRTRIEAWTRAFLRALDDALPPGMAVADAALAWMAANQPRLARTIVAMDRRAKQGEMARGGADAIASVTAVNRIG